MFEFNGSHISALDDTNLRTLIALLCEAELRRAQFPVSAVTAGGDQSAADGGLDVRVDLPLPVSMSGFIPRPITGFQVKLPDMPRSKILEEMRPGGTLRPVLQELASVSGAYIIISAQGSTSDSSLQRRREAMREAAASAQNAEALALDFYDRERLASWVRDHPGLVVWVRERIGLPIRGWRPYANWAAPSESLEAEYLLDEKSRFYDWRSLQEGDLTVSEGIQRIREALARPKGVVRLVGLSGMGKTRLVQALFDARVGDLELDPMLAIYTDLAEEPDPSPRDFMRRLVQNEQRAIVIVDNCPPETHRALVAICTELSSVISLITVEYDIGDDDPEGTEVFRLEPASNDIIEQLLARNAPQVSQVDRRRIAEFSGGNARIALALSHTVRRGESVANLSDQHLFERLFHQRRPQDEGLLRAAEVCSLVYSFNGEELDGDAAELPFLAELAELTVDQLYRSVAELRSRGLVQRRSKWRAVLPPALANRLARQALEKMPPQQTAAIFMNQAPERILLSFSRRIGYLHDSEEARKIAEIWLSDGGPLFNLSRLNQSGISIFQNLAPAVPEAALDAIERMVNRERGGGFLDVSSPGYHTWISLLKSLAYEKISFIRAALLLSRFVGAEPPNYKNGSAGGAFNNLFQLCLSGTHASIDQRLEVINILLESEDESIQSCGFEALDTLLQTSNFVSFYGFEFGTRPRDYGSHPQSRGDLASWYQSTIDYLRSKALSNVPLASKARSILAQKFRGLWIDADVIEELESAARAIATQGFWPEGWIAVRNSIRFDAERMSPEHLGRLRALEEILRPDDLLQKARAYVFSKPWSNLDIADAATGDAAARIHRRVYETTEALGREVARNNEVLEVLLPELVRGDVGRGSPFGRGLATGADNLSDMWRKLVKVFIAIPERERDTQVMRGFLGAASTRDAEVTNVLLDSAVNEPSLGPRFPMLQMAVDIDQRGLDRLEASLQFRLAPSWTYGDLGHIDANRISTSSMRRLVLGINMLSNGFKVAVAVLVMWLHSARSSGNRMDNELIHCGRELLQRYTFEGLDHMLDYHLGELVDACFADADAVIDATNVCSQLKEALLQDRIYSSNCVNLITSLFRTHPVVALDEFLGDDSGDRNRLFIRSFDFDHENPLETVPMETLTAWAQIDSPVRFLRLASAITPFKSINGRTGLELRPLALQIIKSAPDRIAVLSEFSSRSAGGWSGSYADILERCRALPRAFFSDPDPTVVSWARNRDRELEQRAAIVRSRASRRDESFE
ncbi:MAG: hypothetical protein LLH30_18645 [Candidatus Manganitrophus sp. SA1]|nr:hypothetical protein [Candidatus Manganitrophus morganii]